MQELVDWTTAASKIAQVCEWDRRGPSDERVPVFVDDMVPEIVHVVPHAHARVLGELA